MKDEIREGGISVRYDIQGNEDKGTEPSYRFVRLPHTYIAENQDNSRW